MRWLAFILAFCLAATLCAQGNPTDNRIYDQVREKLTSTRDLNAEKIEVAVHDGVVTLKGSVGDEKQKDRAEKVAKKVKGVKKVENQLTIVSIL